MGEPLFESSAQLSDGAVRVAFLDLRLSVAVVCVREKSTAETLRIMRLWSSDDSEWFLDMVLSHLEVDQGSSGEAL